MMDTSNAAGVTVTGKVTCVNKCGGSSDSNTLNIVQAAEPPCTFTPTANALTYATVALPVSNTGAVVISEFRNFFFSWENNAKCLAKDLLTQNIALVDGTNFKISANNRDIVAKDSALANGLSTASIPISVVWTPATTSTATAVTSNAFSVTQQCDMFTPKTLSSAVSTVTWGSASTVVVADLVSTFYNNCNGVKQVATSCSIITSDPEYLSYNATTGVSFVKTAADYTATFKANCTMTGTTVPVVSAEYTVTYTTCSTVAKTATVPGFSLTSSFANPVATYGMDSVLEVVGTTSASPF